MTSDLEVRPAAFFELAEWELPELFAPDQPVWSALSRLSQVLAARLAGCGTPPAPAGVHLEGDIYLGKGVVLEPGCFVRGPALLLDGAQVRHGAYIRGQVVVGPGATVGHCSELKHSILLAGAAAPHFNYVGDSILGARVNLGAGTVLSNLKLRGATVRVRLEGRCYDTGLRKLGAILGDDTQTGCHTVLNPGTLAGPGSLFYPQANAVGYFAPRSLVRTAVTMGGRD